MPATPETIARVRERYAAGDPVRRILADARMSSGTFYHWLDGGPDDGCGPRLPPIPRRNQAGVRRVARRTPTRVSLVKRLWRTAELQVRDIEERLRLNQEPDERERDARVLAVIVKTVRELRAMQGADDKESAENDNATGNIDDFRRELARKIDGIIARRGERTVGDAESR